MNVQHPHIEDRAQGLPGAVDGSISPGGGSSTIKHDKVRLLYANSPAGLSASFALATVVVAAHWPVASHLLLLAWWCGVALLTAARAVVVARFRRLAGGTLSAFPWFAWHFAGVALSGVAWGAAGILLFTPDSVAHQAFLTLTLGGITIGAVTAYAASFATFLVFALPTCLPIIAWFFLMGDRLHVAMGTTVVIFVGIIARLAWIINQGIVRTSELSAAHKLTVAALQKSHEELEQRVEELAELRSAETAMHETKARFISIYESSKDAIAYLTLDGQLLDVNDAFVKLTGHPREELLTKTYQDLTPTEYRKFEADIIQKVIGNGEPVEYEKEYLRKDGSRVAISLTMFVIKDQGGRPGGLATIVKDITERKRLEGQLRQAQKMEAVGQLAGGIAHDFNNILTVINGYSELSLATLPAGDPLRENVQQVKEAGERAAGLTRQLLAFSRRQVLESRVLDLNTVVTNVEKMLTRVIGEDIAIVAVLTPGLSYVKADPGQIEQVIINLVVNARDAMPQGGKLTLKTANVELDNAYVRTHAGAKPGLYAMLAVSDNGCGMDAETQRHIFEPFFTTKAQGKGTGLGLATAYGIVKQSNGYIGVDSGVGRGTTFTVYLPRVEETPVAARPSVSPADQLAGSETILLVEDDAGVKKIAAQILTTYGYVVLEAGRGEEALLVNGKHNSPISLMVTDVVMPGMNGRELAERMRTLRPDMKVLFVSGYTEDAVVQHEVLEARMAFLQKPFTQTSLLRKVREVLDSAK